MGLTQVPFVRYKLEEEKAEEKRKIFTISLNLEEYKQLQEDMKELKQPKDSTCIKQLWKIGRIVLHDNQTGLILKTILGNSIRNERIGISEVEPTPLANVTQKTEQV